MQANRSRDTGPELAVRRALHAAGLRYRTNLRISAGDVKVRADIAFTKRRVAVFVDGCFWHGCPVHRHAPVRNADFWAAKVEHNHARDALVTEALEADGWRVLRVWEHQDPAEVEREVRSALSED